MGKKGKNKGGGRAAWPGQGFPTIPKKLRDLGHLGAEPGEAPPANSAGEKRENSRENLGKKTPWVPSSPPPRGHWGEWEGKKNLKNQKTAPKSLSIKAGQSQSCLNKSEFGMSGDVSLPARIKGCNKLALTAEFQF